MPNENFIKEITSKDINLSQKIIKEIIDTENVSLFKELCEKSDYIFPFLKTRIIKDFISFINEDNFNITFKFAKVYNYDFGEIILSSWLKNANEDLTDKILELFKNGSNDEKKYCAQYFSYINDSLALEFLNKEAYSSDSMLKINCAKALSKFEDKTVFNNMIEVIENSNDDFEKLEAYQFLIPYDDKNILNFLVENAFKNSLCANIISYIKDYYLLDDLIKHTSKENIIKIFNVIIENYPENIDLDTIIYYEIYDFIEFIKNEYKNQYANNVLYLAKLKFDEFNNNDAYYFDLDRDTKEELKNISKLLNSIEYNFDDLENELKENLSNEERFICALAVISENKFEKYAQIIADFVNNDNLNEFIFANIAQALKELNKLDLIDKRKIESIKDINIKSLILSFFN